MVGFTGKTPRGRKGCSGVPAKHGRRSSHASFGDLRATGQREGQVRRMEVTRSLMGRAGGGGGWSEAISSELRRRTCRIALVRSGPSAADSREGWRSLRSARRLLDEREGGGPEGISFPLDGGRWGGFDRLVALGGGGEVGPAVFWGPIERGGAEGAEKREGFRGGSWEVARAAIAAQDSRGGGSAWCCGGSG